LSEKALYKLNKKRYGYINFLKKLGSFHTGKDVLSYQ